MIRRWLTSSSSSDTAAIEENESYECAYCQRGYDSFASDCPRCGQLVVRIVDSSG